MLCSVVDPALGAAYKSSKRRAVDDGATALLAHLLQLELHATPYAPQIDRHHPVVIVSGRISSFCKDILNAGIVVGCIEPPESRDSLLNHVLNLSVIGDVADDSECFVTLGSQFLGGRTHRLLMPVRQHHRST